MLNGKIIMTGRLKELHRQDARKTCVKNDMF